jgi:hypothetical protein
VAIAENLEEGERKRKNREKKEKRDKGKRRWEERKRDKKRKTEGMWRESRGCKKGMIGRGMEEEPKEIKQREVGKGI